MEHLTVLPETNVNFAKAYGFQFKTELCFHGVNKNFTKNHEALASALTQTTNSWGKRDYNLFFVRFCK